MFSNIIFYIPSWIFAIITVLIVFLSGTMFYKIFKIKTHKNKISYVIILAFIIGLFLHSFLYEYYSNQKYSPIFEKYESLAIDSLEKYLDEYYKNSYLLIDNDPNILHSFGETIVFYDSGKCFDLKAVELNPVKSIENISTVVVIKRLEDKIGQYEKSGDGFHKSKGSAFSTHLFVVAIKTGPGPQVIAQVEFKGYPPSSSKIEGDHYGFSGAAEKLKHWLKDNGVTNIK